MTQEQKERLLRETEKLHNRHLLSETAGKDYYEPGMMEYPEQYDGYYDETSNELILYFDLQGTRYEGRSERIEKVKTGDRVILKRDVTNVFDQNSFLIMTEKGWDIGYMPSELSAALAPLYDAEELCFDASCISYVEPISVRSRYAEQAIVFVKLKVQIL